MDELPDIDFTAMWRRRLEQEKGAGAATARGQRGCARCGAQVTQGIKHVLLGECVHAHVAPELKDIAREMHAIKAYLIKKQEPRDSPQIKMLQTAADAIARWAYSQKTVTNEEWKCISKVWAGVLPACRRQREDKDKKAVAEAVTQKIIGIQRRLLVHLREWRETTGKAQRELARQAAIDGDAEKERLRVEDAGKKVIQTAVKTAIDGVMARAAERRRQEQVRANARREEDRRRDIGAAGALHTRQMAAAKKGRGRAPDGSDEFRPQTKRPTQSRQHADEGERDIIRGGQGQQPTLNDGIRDDVEIIGEGREQQSTHDEETAGASHGGKQVREAGKQAAGKKSVRVTRQTVRRAGANCEGEASGSRDPQHMNLSRKKRTRETNMDAGRRGTTKKNATGTIKKDTG